MYVYGEMILWNEFSSALLSYFSSQQCILLSVCARHYNLQGIISHIHTYIHTKSILQKTYPHTWFIRPDFRMQSEFWLGVRQQFWMLRSWGETPPFLNKMLHLYNKCTQCGNPVFFLSQALCFGTTFLQCQQVSKTVISYLHTTTW